MTLGPASEITDHFTNTTRFITVRNPFESLLTALSQTGYSRSVLQSVDVCTEIRLTDIGYARCLSNSINTQVGLFNALKKESSIC